jgi:NAD-dependent dihydropyrimidine dehydrogenase PreA subunit
MAKVAIRKIVRIDEEKCDGCGLCVPNCAEGALRIINGKARLVAENLCDGLGACLGECPKGAITVEERAADEFDEGAVKEHLHARKHGTGAMSPLMTPALAPARHVRHGGGCPGSRARLMQVAEQADETAPQEQRKSRLGQWPVQLALVPTEGPMWQDADVLIAADCVAFAYAEFHEKMLKGKRLAIACPKLDDVGPYVEKLARIFARNSIRSITVAHMEVPCCGGIVRAVQMALAQAGRTDLPVRDVTVGVDGSLRGGHTAE